jgi:hypothetical protein
MCNHFDFHRHSSPTEFFNPLKLNEYYTSVLYCKRSLEIEEKARLQMVCYY